MLLSEHLQAILSYLYVLMFSQMLFDYQQSAVFAVYSM